MLKWLLAIALVVLVLGAFAPRLRKLGLWRLPGDITLRLRGRDVFLPFTSTILITVVLTLLLRVFRL
jgi:hypothetical protein